MRVSTGVSALLAALLCLVKGSQGLTNQKLAHPNKHSPSVGDSYNSTGDSYDTSQVNCTAVVTIYGVATGNNTDTEIFFDAWQDPYQTTGVLSLQVELEDSQLEDVDVNTLSYKVAIVNHFYKYLGWTSTYAIDALGDIDQPSSHGETVIHVRPFLDNPDHAYLTPGFFNMGFFSDAPKSLHTYDTNTLSKAFIPEQVMVNDAECDVVLA